MALQTCCGVPAASPDPGFCSSSLVSDACPASCFHQHQAFAFAGPGLVGCVASFCPEKVDPAVTFLLAQGWIVLSPAHCSWCFPLFFLVNHPAGVLDSSLRAPPSFGFWAVSVPGRLPACPRPRAGGRSLLLPPSSRSPSSPLTGCAILDFSAHRP